MHNSNSHHVLQTYRAFHLVVTLGLWSKCVMSSDKWKCMQSELTVYLWYNCPRSAPKQHLFFQTPPCVKNVVEEDIRKLPELSVGYWCVSGPWWHSKLLLCWWIFCTVVVTGVLGSPPLHVVPHKLQLVLKPNIIMYLWSLLIIKWSTKPANWVNSKGRQKFSWISFFHPSQIAISHKKGTWKANDTPRVSWRWRRQFFCLWIPKKKTDRRWRHFSLKRHLQKVWPCCRFVRRKKLLHHSRTLALRAVNWGSSRSMRDSVVTDTVFLLCISDELKDLRRPWLIPQDL